MFETIRFSDALGRRPCFSVTLSLQRLILDGITYQLPVSNKQYEVHLWLPFMSHPARPDALLHIVVTRQALQHSLHLSRRV